MSQNSAKFYKKTDCLDRVLKICHSVIANKPLRKPHNLEKLNFSITNWPAETTKYFFL